jgi:hypothetical protein
MRRARTDRNAFTQGAAFRAAWAAACERRASRRSGCTMPGHKGCRREAKSDKLDKIGVA